MGVVLLPSPLMEEASHPSTETFLDIFDVQYAVFVIGCW